MALKIIMSTRRQRDRVVCARDLKSGDPEIPSSSPALTTTFPGNLWFNSSTLLLRSQLVCLLSVYVNSLFHYPCIEPPDERGQLDLHICIYQNNVNMNFGFAFRNREKPPRKVATIKVPIRRSKQSIQ